MRVFRNLLGGDKTKKTETSNGHGRANRKIDGSLRNSLESENDSEEEVETYRGEPRVDDNGYDYASSIIGGSSTHSGSKEDRIFSFSLPFGTSIMPKFRFPFFTENESEKEALRLKLKRSESLSTLEEELLLKDTSKLDNPRFRAVKRALTPVGIASDIKHYITDRERPDYETIYDELEGDILVLGGYRGSILRDAVTKRRVWIPVIKAGFNLRKINLYVGAKDEDELDAYRTVYADGMLTHIGPIDISKRLIKRLKNGKTEVHDFGYDWRLSCDIGSQLLYNKLIEINKKNGGKGCLIIAHSMGGLIAHHAMQKDPSLVRGIVYAGVPAECPNVLGPLRFGDSVLFSSRILTAEINFLMRSSFVFLPLDGRLFYDKKAQKSLDLDYFDPDVWVEYNLSPLVCKERKTASEVSAGEIMDKTTPITENQLPNNEWITSFEDAYDYLQRTLKRSKKFLLDLKLDSEKQYPPLACVYGNSVPSVRESKVDGIEGLKKGEYFDFLYGLGDGVVHQKWLMPEMMGFSVKGKFASEFGHVSLLTDHDNIGRALVSILK